VIKERNPSANNKKFTERYSYLLAFILGMTIMVLMYVVFEAITDSNYRTRTAGDTDYGPIVQTAMEADSSPAVFLGVEVIPVNSVIAEQMNLGSETGVLVNYLVPGSPAQSAGLRRGDVIIALDNKRVKDIETFKDILAGFEPGDRTRVIYVRDGKKDSTRVELIESVGLEDREPDKDAGSADWGVSLAPVNPSLRDSFSVPGDIDGIMILSVEPGGLADEAGLKNGDVIAGIGKTPVNDMNGFFDGILSDKNSTAVLDIYSQGQRRYVPIDSTALQVVDRTQDRNTATLKERIFAIFTGAAPFADDDEEEGPKGGKFTDEDVALTSDNVAFNRPSSPPGEANAGGTGSTGDIALNRPSQVPPQIGNTNDVVLFAGLLIIVILYLAYREFHRPPDLD